MKLLAPGLLGVLTLADGLRGQEAARGPDALVPAGVPHGALTWPVLPPGNFYPGTPHRYERIFEYDSLSACFSRLLGQELSANIFFLAPAPMGVGKGPAAR